jgi:hypothetical protein
VPLEEIVAELFRTAPRRPAAAVPVEAGP